MKYRRLGIIQPGKIGDIIICLPIAKYYFDRGYEIYWPVDYSIIQNFQEYVDYVKWIPISWDCQLARQICMESDCTKIIDLSFTVTGANTFNSNNFLHNQNKYSFDEYKYYLADVPFEEKWKLEITRNIDRELELYNKVKDTEYATLQLQSSDYTVTRPNFQSDITYDKTVLIEKGAISVFDWIMVLGNAQSHILIESCFVNLIDQMGIIVAEQVCLLKHGYYNRPLEDGHLRGVPRLKLNWKYI